MGATGATRYSSRLDAKSGFPVFPDPEDRQGNACSMETVNQRQPKTLAPHPIGRRFLVVPAAIEPPPDTGRTLLRIDAGSAFGDGAHPTTQLCLAALERHCTSGALIDLGAGTGILSIAAARLGAAAVLGVDIDAASVAIARANVERNDVAATVRMEQGSLADVLAGRFGLAHAPVVVANILANVLVDFFAAGLVESVEPGGLLILSGILRTQGPEIRARLGWHGLTLAAEERREEWLCVIARRAK